MKLKIAMRYRLTKYDYWSHQNDLMTLPRRGFCFVKYTYSREQVDYVIYCFLVSVTIFVGKNTRKFIFITEFYVSAFDVFSLKLKYRLI